MPPTVPACVPTTDPAFWDPENPENRAWRRGVADEFAATIKDLTGKPPPPAMSHKSLDKILGGVSQSAGFINRMYRENVLYNVRTGYRGWAQDVISTSIKAMWEGHTGAVGTSLANWLPAMRNLPDAMDAYIARMGMSDVRELHIPGKFDSAAETERMAVHEALNVVTRSKPGSWKDTVNGFLTAPIAGRFVAKGRGASDNAMRRAVFLDTAEAMTPAAAREWRRLMRKWGNERGILESSTSAYLYELGDQFSPAEALDVVRELSLDAGLPRAAADEFASMAAQQWRKSVNTVRGKALAETNRVLFSYEKTNLDEAVGRLVFFHYWMTRSLPSYFRMALHNPELAAMWMRAWSDLGDRAEREGYPPSMVGYLRFFGNASTGWAHSYNPLQFFIPFDVLRSDPNANTSYEQLTQFMATSPVIQGVAAAAGWSTQTPDMLGLYAVRDASNTLINEMRAHGWIGETSLPDDWYEQATQHAFEYVNGLVSHLPYTNEVHFRSRNDYNTEVIDYMMRDEIATSTGVPYDATNPQWMPGGALFERWAEAKRDFAVGDPNWIAKKVYKDWAAQEAIRLGLSTVVPGGIKSRYGPRDTALAAAKAGDMGEALFREFARTGSPEAFTRLELDTQLKQLGTENGRQGYQLWNDIAYPDEIANDQFIMIDGELISGFDIHRMTQGQRERLADRWLAQYEGVPEEVAAYRVLRDDFIKAHPELGEFKDYQHGVGSAEGGITKWRTDYAKGDPTFADAMAKEESYQRSLGKTGEVLKGELDQWALSLDAYNAATGYRSTTYQDVPTPKVPDYGFTPPEESKTGGEKKDPMTVLADHLKSYREKMDEALKAMNEAGYAVTETDLVSGSPLYRDVLGNYGVPQIDRDISLYLQWSAHNDGASIDEYISYLERLAEEAA